ncbi:MAG TPA: RNHCP domain-containing protein [Thermomicrobiales bacterium]|nr:RNHCP domain-containing protein [Thermomicrobiales bacterium]
MSRTGTWNHWIDDDENDEPDSWRSRSSYRRSERLYRAPSRRQTETEEFKCGHCKTFVGPPISGGRHRNHCPLCLFSKHVDHAPGDRKNTCRSLMEPIGTAFRRNGEQVIVHRCLGCGEVRYCRAAADDHLLVCMRLPPMELPMRLPHEESEEAIA